VSRAVDEALAENTQYYRNRLTELAVPFVHQESNGQISMNLKTIQILQNNKYKGGTGPRGADPISLTLEVPEEPQAAPAPLIQEVSTKKKAVCRRKEGETVRKGFLSKKDGTGLYGPQGSAEGVVPDGAGDPLGYLPKSFREKCQVVNTGQLTPEQQEQAVQQYAQTGTSQYAEPGMAMKKAQEEQEAKNAAYWEAKRQEADTSNNNDKASKVQKGFLNSKSGAGLYGDEDSNEGAQNSSTKAARSKGNPVAEGLLQGMGGLDNLEFDDFMKMMGDNEIDPEEFSEQMRSMADLLMADEGGAEKFDQDVRDTVSVALEEHAKANGGEFNVRPQGGKASSSNEIWSAEEITEEEEGEVPDVLSSQEVAGQEAEDVQEPRASALDVQEPRASTQLLRGEDLGDDKLQVTIELPELESICDVDLEVTRRALSLEVDGLYKLELRLEHEVDDDNVSAKFDKTARTLVVCVPVNY